MASTTDLSTTDLQSLYANAIERFAAAWRTWRHTENTLAAQYGLPLGPRDPRAAHEALRDARETLVAARAYANDLADALRDRGAIPIHKTTLL